MTHYLIDIRLMGSVKQQISELSNHLHQKFNIGNKGVIPHITLVGPFFTNDEKKLVADFTRISANLAAVPRYEVGGYGFFNDSRVIFVTITPDATLKQFRHQLQSHFHRTAHYGNMTWMVRMISGSMQPLP